MRPRKLSAELWGAWFDSTPIHIDDIVVSRGTIDEAMPFIQSEYQRCFEETVHLSPFLDENFDARKRCYYERVADFFILRRGEETVGVFIGNPHDWSTYYFRSATIIPELRGNKVMYTFTKILLHRLAEAGVDRVDIDTAPSNLVMITLLNRLGFNITGTWLSERWGAMTSLTKYLSKEAESVFLDQFCRSIRYQQKKTETIERSVR